MTAREQSIPQTFRAGVGAVIQRADGCVLAFQRIDDPSAWQFPQGGLNLGETPLDALFREIYEETGLCREQVSLQTNEPQLLAYELPKAYRSPRTGRGQALYWFNLQFHGPDDAITLGDGKEFTAWEWLPMDEVLKRISPFRKEVYERLSDTLPLESGR